MFGWMRRLWFRKAGYRCDGCGQWTPRAEGRATVRAHEEDVNPVGTVVPGGRVRVVRLYCARCA